MDKQDKKLIDEKVFKILIDMARLYAVDPKPEVLKFGIAMFCEGVGFINMELGKK